MKEDEMRREGLCLEEEHLRRNLSMTLRPHKQGNGTSADSERRL
jgi:hypothetical protein